MQFDLATLIIGILIGLVGSPILMKLLKRLKDSI
jgi:hypothetical protein